MGYVLTATVLLVGARLLSIVAWLCITPQVRWPPRALRIALVLGLVLLSATFAPTLVRELVPTALALLYFAALVPSVYALAGAWSPTGWSGFTASLAAWLTVSLLIPMHFVSGDARLPFIAKGFEFALASHSYLVDSKRLQVRDLRQCFFFLLVNPVLVFHQFGKRSGAPSLVLRDVGRCAVGVCTIAAFFGLDVLIARLPFTDASMEVTRVQSLTDYGEFVAATGLLALSTYLAHSGTASVQIGAMRIAGYVIPERYNYAFLAVTPADWWRRWNTYVSSWFASYCLLPSLIFFRRHTRLPALVAGALSILSCFFVSGLIHALSSTSTKQGSVIIFCFVVEALLLMTWLGASRLGLKLVERLPPPLGTIVRRVAPVASWAARVQVNMVILSLLFPMLTGGQAAR